MPIVDQIEKVTQATMEGGVESYFYKYTCVYYVVGFFVIPELRKWSGGLTRLRLGIVSNR